MAKVSSGFLLGLVVLSVYLAGQLMSGQVLPDLPREHHDFVYFGPKPGLREISLPGRAYISDGAGSLYQLKTFSPLYFEMLSLLAKIDYSMPGTNGDEVWTRQSFPLPELAAHYPAGVLFRYNTSISRELLALFLVNFHQTDLPFDYVNAVFLPRGTGKAWFFNFDANEAWGLEVEVDGDVLVPAVLGSPDILAVSWRRMQAMAKVAVGPGVYEPDAPFTLVVPDWQREDLGYAEIVRSFHLDQSATRVLQETDGAEIYTDGVRALRIYPYGALEFYAVGSQNQGEFIGQVTQVDRALAFVSRHGGWGNGMLLSGTSVRAGGGIGLEFCTYGQGLPILGATVGVVVVLEDSMVQQYRRHLIIAEGGPSSAVVAQPLSNLVETNAQLAYLLSIIEGSITDLALCYYWHQDELVAAWRIKYGNHVLFVDVTEGRVLYGFVSAGEQ